MKFPAYPKYKDSGVEWLGEVPEHWEVKRLKFIAKMLDDRADANDDNALPYIGLEDIQPWTGKLLPREEDIDPVGVSSKFFSGNVMFSKLRPYLAKACAPGFDGICSSELIVLNFFKNNNCFFVYQMLTSGFVFNVNASAYGVKMPRSSWGFIGSCLVSFPPLPEQRTIAAFLDAQTSKLDTLIAKKCELLEKLKEKRAALITCTVTRGLPPEAAKAAGLDPHPKMKDSGVEWLGEVPEHWEVKRLKHISDGITVGVVVNPSNYVAEEGVPFLLGGNVKEMAFDLASCNRCDPVISNGILRKSQLRQGDIVTVRVGYPGISAVIPYELDGANCASMMIVRRHKRFFSSWLAYSLNSKVGRDQVEIVQYGAAQKQFNISHAVDFSFVYPPISEQRAIAAYLDRETAAIDALVAKVETAIDRLQEYRATLITAAVTGQIDVREAVQ